MERKKIVIGLLSFLFLLLGLLQPFVVQAAEEEQVRIQIAGLV